MPEKKPTDGQPVPRRKYTPAFKAECVRQVAGARQSDVARAQGISLTLLDRWQWAALEQAIPSSAEREEIKRLRAELKRVETERDILKSGDHLRIVSVVSKFLFVKAHAGMRAVSDLC